MELHITVEHRDGTRAPHQLEFAACVAIGYAGRDQASVKHHVEELARIGVPGPSTVPSMYWVAPAQVQQTRCIQVVGEETSAEVEVFLACDAAGKLFVTVLSDHSDRKLETVSVSKAKQICPKVIGGVFWPVQDVADHWDSLTLSCWAYDAAGVPLLYQNAPLAALLPWDNLYERATAAAPVQGRVACGSGTIPILDGITRYAKQWEIRLEDPLLKRSIIHTYSVVTLPDIN